MINEEKDFPRDSSITNWEKEKEKDFPADFRR